MTAPSANDLAIARFMRSLSAAALELARQLETATGSVKGQGVQIDIETAGLGSLQLAVARVLTAMDSETGASPREVSKAMDRPDEPNVRSALNRLADRGVAELVPGSVNQRWRLTQPYRAGV